jgi:hypothetical protein
MMIKQTIGAVALYALTACTGIQATTQLGMDYGSSEMDVIHRAVMSPNDIFGTNPVWENNIGSSLDRKATFIVNDWSSEVCTEIKATEYYNLDDGEARFQSATLNIRACSPITGTGRYFKARAYSDGYFEVDENLVDLECKCQDGVSNNDKPILEGVDPDYNMVFIDHKGTRSKNTIFLGGLAKYFTGIK